MNPSKTIPLAWLFVLVLVSPPAGRGGAEDGDMDRIRRLVEHQRSRPIDEYTVFRSPSMPADAARVIPEWAPARALILAIPENDGVLNPDILAFFMDIVEKAVRVTDVMILMDEDELSAQEAVLAGLAERGLDHLLQGDPPGVSIVEARFDSKWIRDYGPVFFIDERGELGFVDSIYRDVKQESDMDGDLAENLFGESMRNRLRRIYGEPYRDTTADERHNDDSVSMYIANQVFRSYGRYPRIVRAPLQLWGGDAFFDGLGNQFVSSETLFMNGGVREDVERLLRHYYGMSNVTYLEPLPGQTIKHIDMIFKPVDGNTLLAAEYPAVPDDEGPYANHLHREARRILERNAELLRKAYPGRKLVRMPMPPMERVSNVSAHCLELTLSLFESSGYKIPGVLESRPEEWTLDRFLYFTFILSAMDELDDSELAGRLSAVLGIPRDSDNVDPVKEDELILRTAAERLVREDPALHDWIAEAYAEDRGMADSNARNTPDVLERLLEDFGYSDVYSNPNGYSYVYKTHLNATHIRGRRGNVLLVPDYTGHAGLRERVGEIYRELYPDTAIEFIDCDAVIEQYGAIHCVTLVLPDMEAMLESNPGELRVR